jgi:hypothetical protein
MDEALQRHRELRRGQTARITRGKVVHLALRFLRVGLCPDRRA